MLFHQSKAHRTLMLAEIYARRVSVSQLAGYATAEEATL